MRVSTDYMDVHQNVDNGKNTISHSSTQTSRIDASGVFAVDISGTVMDNEVYGGHGKTTEEVMQEAGQINVAQQKDYMTVMSHSMSEEDFAKLQKEGYHPGNEEIGTMVTVVDRIKAELIKAGVQVDGYTDTLDTKTLERITGDKAQAQMIEKKLQENDVPVTEENVEQSKEALDKVTELSELSDGVIKYMILNHIEPTIDNIYAAEYSASGDGNRQGRGYYTDDMAGYYAKKAESIDYQQIMPQIEKIINQAGLSVTEETTEEAKWLIEKGVPLTEDTLQQYEALKAITITDDTEQLMNQIGQAISEGKQAGAALLNGEESIYQQAVSYVEEISTITDQAISQVVENEKKITIRNLSDMQKQIQSDTYAGATTIDLGVTAKENMTEERMTGVSFAEELENSPDKFITAKRQLEEIRLQMSVEANVKLLKSGMTIDTTELEALVEAYKQIEEKQNTVLFGNQGNIENTENTEEISRKASLYKDVLGKLTEIANVPAAVVGKAVETGTAFTLNYVHEQGTILQKAYLSAGETYEALMTAPRKDLGDSIKKAFRNVDSLLDEIDMEQNDTNRRAVRILGYNNMEVSQENVEAVKTADEELQRVVRKMTPAATLQMIRDHVNPLETDLTTMENYLSELDNSTLNESEKYSKYLYKLEQNSQITQEEKKAYIGIYRLIRQVEKTDGAAIGTLVHQGREVSFDNLLSAIRSNKKAGMDTTVNDDFGGISSVSGKTESISDQINTMKSLPTEEEQREIKYQENLAKDILDSLDPMVLNQIDLPITNEMTLEQLAEQLNKFQENKENELEMSYQSEELKEVQKINQIEDQVIQSLIDFEQPITMDNLFAANALQNHRGNAFQKLWNASSEEKKEAFTKAMKAFQDSFEQNDIPESDDSSIRNLVIDSCGSFKEMTEEIVQDKLDEANATSIDVKSMAFSLKQINLATNLANEENYEVPVKIGNEITSINLRIIRGNEQSKVRATTDTEQYGKVAAEFSVTTKTVSGYVATDSIEGYEKLKELQDSLEKEMKQVVEKNGKEEKEISIQTIRNTALDINKYQEKSVTDNKVEKVSSKELYFIAKSIISTLQNEE